MYLHGLVGAVLIVSACFGLTEILGDHQSGRLRMALPIANGVGGLLILVYVGLHHLGHSAQESERIDVAHWVIGGAFAVSGIIVGLGRARRPWNQLAELTTPFASTLAGGLFLVHGGRAGMELFLHISIAATLILSSVAHVSVVLAAESSRALRIFATLLLAISGMMLVLYDTAPSDPRISGHVDD